MSFSTRTKTALITGGARRIGAAIAQQLHQDGYTLYIHCRNSTDEGAALIEKLNELRPNSAQLLQADLADQEHVQRLIKTVKQKCEGLDLLINNASSFYPTTVGTATEQQWDDLFSSNAKAPFFLCQGLAPLLKTRGGSIINIADIHAERPLKEHTLYCMAKAANVMLTKSLALELAPEIRVNGIAPGAILWPEQQAELTDQAQQSILAKIPLQRSGSPANIVATVCFLAAENNYVTGQIISIDGGRSISN